MGTSPGLSAVNVHQLDELSRDYEALTDAFTVVGSLVTAREATATAVVLPSRKILIAGGSHCAARLPGRSVQDVDLQGLPVRRARNRRTVQ